MPRASRGPDLSLVTLHRHLCLHLHDTDSGYRSSPPVGRRKDRLLGGGAT